ncbi:quinone-dependent dihydroorotate dehydrogenase [Dongshaea marina]|uniref:quinone-dependent dihydroorotate dehydrogenase n=1 Tax=Dongshaea marina TaxID=2047966 RepID=UPI000D3E3455|nr:quinone-dependent dihydroorotate dehydrogenase [Dongshaea marina]
MLYNLVRSVLFKFDPEKAHDLSMRQLSRHHHFPFDYFYRQNIPDNPVEVMGLTFPNPVGLAAGLDKDGECIEALDAMGFGFIEVGTVTPRPQSGNPKPRLFRVIPAQGIINRMGFNNKGVDNLVENIKAARYRAVLGVNIGKNKDTPIEKGLEDYLICMDKVYQYAGYIAINISSPNTPDLRSLQYGEALDELLGGLKKKQQELAEQHGKYVPLALKIAPDLSFEEVDQVAQALLKHGIDGVIATNTTLDRSLIFDMPHAGEDGGLSGRPLQNRSTLIINHLKNKLEDKLPIIGVGGIDSAMAAREKQQAGAQLVQIYTGFIYKGPELIKEIANAL